LIALRTAGDGDEERVLQSANNSSASLAAAQEDPLFARAVEIVLESRRGSVSLLQRRLAIGYTRSSRLIDLMGIAGIISDHKGSVARDVLITLEDWEKMKAMAADEGSTLLDTSLPLPTIAKPAGKGELFAGDEAGAEEGEEADLVDADAESEEESVEEVEEDGEEEVEEDAELVDEADEDGDPEEEADEDGEGEVEDEAGEEEPPFEPRSRRAARG
jgi:S-DNA-T family DNA segregation ATPase FtsK/SpoIIIE